MSIAKEEILKCKKFKKIQISEKHEFTIVMDWFNERAYKKF